MLEDEKGKSTAYQTQMNNLQGEIRTLKLAQNKTLNYFLDLDGVAEIPNPKNLKVCYKLWGDEDRDNTLNCSPIIQNDKQRLLVTLSDLDPKSFVTSLTVEDITTKHKWRVKSFFPLSPALTLTPVN
jgi:hypothetical protein